METRLDTWTAVEAEIDRIVNGSGDEHSFDHGTLANVREFVRFAGERCPVPQVGKGYWSTIRFSWRTTPPLEVEVHGDRFEVYRFHDGHTDIKEVRHTPGSTFPEELAADLPSRD